MRFENGRTTSH